MHDGMLASRSLFEAAERIVKEANQRIEAHERTEAAKKEHNG